MKRICILLFLNLFAIAIYGQRGYYSTDSVTTSGVLLIDGGKYSNSRFVLVKMKKETIKLSPDTVLEYSFNNGRVYKSFNVILDSLPERFFFKRLVEGRLELYYLSASEGKSRYYINYKDSKEPVLIPSDNEGLINLLDQYTGDCENTRRNIRLLKYNDKKLTRYLDDYNDCSDRPFPVVQFGLKFGISGIQISSVSNTSIYSLPKYGIDWNLSAGVFMDIPINTSNLSFTPEIYFNQNHSLRSIDNSGISYDLIMNYSTINIPLLIRYSFLHRKYSPFIQGGPVYSHTLRNATDLYKYESVGNDTFIDLENSPVRQNNMGGVTLGSGIISNYGDNFSWFGEVRFCHFFNLSQTGNYLNFGELTMAVGLMF